MRTLKVSIKPEQDLEAAINQIVSELLCSLNTVRPSGTPDTIEIHFIDCLIY